MIVQKKKDISDEELLGCYEDELKAGIYTREENLSRKISEQKIVAQQVPMSALYQDPRMV